jgi:hypothetical protein
MKPIQTGLPDDQVGPSVEDIENAYTDEDREVLRNLLNLLASGLPGLKVEAGLAVALRQFIQFLNDDNELMNNIACAAAFDTARWGYNTELINERRRTHVVCSFCRVEHHVDAMPEHMKTCTLHPMHALTRELVAEKAFHNLAVKERDYERVRFDRRNAAINEALNVISDELEDIECLACANLSGHAEACPRGPFNRLRAVLLKG